MKKIAYTFATAILLLLTTTRCQEELPAPLMQAEEVMAAVRGKWSIGRIDYQLCREPNCTTSTYTGHASDYFEFRADSAFLVLTNKPQAQQKEQFKVTYSLKESFVLTKGEWAGKFELKEVKTHRLVLQHTFIGRDPHAVFTDTYYLTR